LIGGVSRVLEFLALDIRELGPGPLGTQGYRRDIGDIRDIQNQGRG
jgi:hypothetical protein